MELESKKEKILIYVASKIHILNAMDISKQLNSYEVILIYESDILKNLKDFKDLKILDQHEYSKYIYNNIKEIYLIIFSTSQIRNIPINLVYLSMINKINTLSFQETHQMFLHDCKINNYLLPINKILLSSYYEKKKFMDYGYREEKLYVTGYYYYRNKYDELKKINISKKNKNIVLFLNAASRNSVSSIESYNLQKKIINRLYESLKNDYFIIIKTHPVDYHYYNRNSLYNNLSNLKIINTDINISDLINKSEFVFLTGYSQILIESIINKSKIFILKYEDNLVAKNFDNIIHKDENIKIRLQKLYNHNFKEIININNIYLSRDSGKINIINEIKNFNNNNYYIDSEKFYISLLMIYTKNKNCFNKIKNLSFNNKNNHLLIKKIYFSNISHNNFLILLNNFKNQINIFHLLKYLYLDYIIKNKIKIDKNNINHFLIEEPIYLLNFFFNNKQRLINYFLINNYYNEALMLNRNQHYVYNNIISNKNILFKIYIYLRNFFINYKIKYFYNIVFQLYELYYKYKVVENK